MSMQLDQLCQQFREEWNSGRPDFHSFLSTVPPDERTLAAARLLEIDISHRVEAGEHPQPSDYSGYLSEAELSSLSKVFESAAFTKSTGRSSIGQTWHNEQQQKSKTVVRETIGRYRVLGLLGEGSFGTVYRAHDEKLSREVAIKVPRLTSKGSPAQVQNLLHEARSAASLPAHPNVVSVHDCGELDDGGCFVVFEFVPGGHLGQETLGRKLEVERVVELMAGIADGVHHAHKHGLFHRDLKPANILVAPDGTPKITDFGLVVHDDEQSERRGEITGTPSYMSPEQVRGESHLLDGRTDIWSLGVLMYELLAGKRPFVGEDANALFKMIRDLPPRPLRQFNEQVHPDLEAICRKCLRKSPDQRYATAMDLSRDLQRLSERVEQIDATGSFRVSTKAPPPERRVTDGEPQPPSNKRRISKKTAIGLVLGLCAFAIAIPFLSENEPLFSTISMLEKRPETLAWDHDAGESKPWDHDPRRQTLSIPNGILYAKTGLQPLGPLHFKAFVRFEGTPASAGLFWGLREHSTKLDTSTCFVAKVMRFGSGEVKVIIDENTLSCPDGYIWKQSYSRPVVEWTLSNLPKDSFAGTPVLVEVKIRDSQAEFLVDGQSVGVVADSGDFPTFLPESSCEIGIYGMGIPAVISKATVSSLQE